MIIEANKIWDEDAIVRKKKKGEDVTVMKKKKKKRIYPPSKKISKNSHWGNFYWFDSSQPRLPVVTVKVLEYDYSAPIAVDAATTAVFILIFFIFLFFYYHSSRSSAIVD